MKIALTEKNYIECDAYIYPADIFDIEGLKEYSDVETLENYTRNKMEVWQNKHIDLYINGGLLLEILAVIRVAYQYHSSIDLYHYNRDNGRFIKQTVFWYRAEYSIEQREKSQTVEALLIDNRHVSSCKNVIFSERIPNDKVLDMMWLEDKAEQFLHLYENQNLRLYVTGLTPAVVAVLNQAAEKNISVTALHFDVDKEEYFEQKVID